MEVLDKAKELANSIKASEEYKIFAQYKEELGGNETVFALIKELQRLQTIAQLKAVAGDKMDDSDLQRMTQIASLLYTDPRASGYLLSQMRLQKLVADVIQIISEAADLPIDLPK